jgi:hypothetical protein
MARPEPRAGLTRGSPGTVLDSSSYRKTMLSRPVHALPRLAVTLLVASLLIVAAPSTASAARGYTLDVGRRADFVAQTNFVQCVGASMQMMLNMIEPGRDLTAKTQLRLQKLARGRSGPRPDGSMRQGASVVGWASGLNTEGAGPYTLAGAKKIGDALKIAAKAMRRTGKPVGLLMWHGRHAWVMSGFRATADPLLTDDFKVTSVIVEDPLYPYGSKVWGASPRPGETLTVKELGRQFVPRRKRSNWNFQRWGANLAGMYVMVVPVQVVRPVPDFAGFAPIHR